MYSLEALELVTTIFAVLPKDHGGSKLRSGRVGLDQTMVSLLSKYSVVDNWIGKLTPLTEHERSKESNYLSGKKIGLMTF
jgi:hypothetical protein